MFIKAVLYVLRDVALLIVGTVICVALIIGFIELFSNYPKATGVTVLSFIFGGLVLHKYVQLLDKQQKAQDQANHIGRGPQ